MPDLVREQRAAIARDYRTILAVRPDFESVASLREFIWACMVVVSRNFSVHINGLSTSAIVPYADILNHRRPDTGPETTYRYDNSSRSFVITTLRRSVGGSVGGAATPTAYTI